MHNRRAVRNAIYHLFVVAFGLLMIYPVLWMILSSFKMKSEILGTDAPFWPSKWIWQNYPDGWKGEGDGAEISFRLAFRTLGILFLKTVDGTSGKAEVLLDGEKRADLDADFTGGWGNAVAAGEVFTGDAAGEHTLTVRLKEAGKKFELLGLLVSG